MLKKTSNTGYLARLAKDFPAIMDEIARTKKGDKRTVEAFLSAVETLSKVKEDPELYNLAVKASANKHGLVDGNLLRGLKIL